MTAEEKLKEPDHRIILPTHHFEKYVDLTQKEASHDPQFLPKMAPEATKKLNLNFSEGTALRCLDQIVCSNDIMEARNQIRAAQEVGKTLRQELEDARGCTAGVIVRAKEHRLGLTIKDFVLEHKEKQREEAQAAAAKASAYQSKCSK